MNATRLLVYLLSAAVLLAGIVSAGVPADMHADTAADGAKFADAGHGAALPQAGAEGHGHHCHHDNGCLAHCAGLTALVATLTPTSAGNGLPCLVHTGAALERLPAAPFRPPIASA